MVLAIGLASLQISRGGGNSLKTNELATQQAAQPAKPIKVTVKDAAGEAVIGAVVSVQGVSGRSTSSDVNGMATISAAPGEVIAVNYMGFEPQTFSVTGQEAYTITLKEDAVALEQVVVVGYGTTTKANLTGAVAQVSGKKLEDRPITNIAQGLQGLVPGMVVVASQGRPGQDGSTIRIRGEGTLNNANPYILIDGIESGDFNSLDPNDIASVSVLKDAASAAIYGSKAANGVILITTKRGKVGKPTVSYNGNFGIQNATELIQRMSSGDYAKLFTEAQKAAGQSPKFTDAEIQLLYNGTEPYKYPNTDWYGLAYQTGYLTTHNISISGGTENVRYMASAGYLGQKGILAGANRDQFNLRTNIDADLSKHFTARVNLSYINNKYQDPTSTYAGGSSDQIIRQLNRISPWIVNQYEDGKYGAISDGNPMAWLNAGEKVKRENQNISAIAALDYKIIDGLKLTVQGSHASYVQNYSLFVKDIRYDYQTPKDQGPNYLSEAYYTWDRSGLDVLLNFDRTFGDHTIKFLGGYHMEAYRYKELTGYRETFPTNDLTDMNAGTKATQTNGGYTRELNMISWFGRLNYDFRGKYLLEANFRADASSRFAPDSRWGFFPSFSAGWVISQENFMAGATNWVQQLKIRGSWGELGNQEAMSSNYYPWQSLYNVAVNAVLDGKLQAGTAQTAWNLPTISWERSTSYGVGLDAMLFNGLSLSLDWYVRETNGIIMSVPVPTTFGLDAYQANVGAMKNTGIEATIGYTKNWGDWSFGANVNFGWNQNTLTNYGNKEQEINGNFIRKIGYALDSYYTYKVEGIFQSDAEADAYTTKYGNPTGRKFKAGDFRFAVDENIDNGKLTSNQRVILNSEQPKFMFGLSLNGAWKGIDVSMMFSGVAGVSRYYNNEAFGAFAGDDGHPSTFWLDAWSPTNTGSNRPRVSVQGTASSEPNYVSSYWIMDASYVRMKNLQVGYTFPQRMMANAKINKLRIYYSGENLFTISALPINIDPETPSGRLSTYPLIASHSLGLTLTF